MRYFKYLISAVFLIFASSINGNAQTWKVMKPMPVKLTFPVVDVYNGNIHVVGGGGPSGATNLHLRYSSSTNTWDTLKSVPYLAQQPGGGFINGKLHYLGGGFPNSGTRLDDHYSYDPDTDTWTKEANVPIPRVIHKTAVLGDSMYVLSGQPDKQRVDVYNAKTKTWTQKNNLPDNNFWYSGIAVHNDKIYRFGGGGSISATSVAHVYDHNTDSWSSLSDMPKARHAPDAVALGDSIYIGGGYLNGTYLSSVLIYDIANDSYHQGPWFAEPKSYHNLVRIDQCIYSLGGNNTVDPTALGVKLTRYCKGEAFSGIKANTRGKSTLKMSYNFDGLFIIHSSDNSPLPIEITLFDLSGKELVNKVLQVYDRQVKLDVSPLHLSPSVYVIKCVQGNVVIHQKIWLD